MKRAIKGKIYNTETATKICEAWNGLSRSDFRCLERDLYKTKKGQYFLSGFGGAMTEHAHSYGGSSSGSEFIKLVTESEALEFCEVEALDPEIIAKHFEIEEG